MAEKQEAFRVIISGVDASQREKAAEELSRTLSMPRASAEKILSNPPIVLIDGLNPEQARNAESHLGNLRRLGVEVKVTDESVGKMPKCTWPSLPAVALIPQGLIVCPHCGEKFLLEPVPGGGMTQTVRLPRRPIQPVGEPEPEGEVAAREATTMPEQEVPSEEGGQQGGEPTTAVISSEEAEEDLESLIREASAVVEATRKRVEEPKEEDKPQELSEEPSPFEQMEGGEEESEVEVESTLPPPPPRRESGGYDVSVIKVKKKRKEQVAELICLLQQVDAEEALQMVDQTVAFVLRDGSKEQAQYAIEQLKKLGVKYRVKKH